MEQKIVNIKAGQKFIIVKNTSYGFPKGCVVEALWDSEDCGEVVHGLKWVDGYEIEDEQKQVDLSHYTVDLKRYKGKIK